MFYEKVQVIHHIHIKGDGMKEKTKYNIENIFRGTKKGNEAYKEFLIKASDEITEKFSCNKKPLS